MVTWAASSISPQQRLQSTNYSPAEGGEEKHMQVCVQKFIFRKCVYVWIPVLVCLLIAEQEACISSLIFSAPVVGLVPIARSSLQLHIKQPSILHTQGFIAVIDHVISKYTITSLKNVLLWYCGIKWQPYSFRPTPFIKEYRLPYIQSFFHVSSCGFYSLQTNCNTKLGYWTGIVFIH